MNMRKGFLACLVMVGLLCVPLGAMATPVFSIDTMPDWQAALDPVSGQISPVDDWVFEGMVASSPDWPDEYSSPDTVFLTPELYVIDGEYDSEPGLVMAWGPPEPPSEATRYAAAWDYEYPLDPDLTGFTIEFSIFPPVLSTFFSLNLIDGAGNFREWIWHAGEEGEVPAGQWSNIRINPATGWSNWPTYVDWFDGGPFDLTNVVALRFDENIIWDPAAPPLPPGWPPGPSVILPDGSPGNIPPGWLWNAWDHVAVTPEPATMLLLGGGLLALARRRRRRK